MYVGQRLVIGASIHHQSPEWILRHTFVCIVQETRMDGSGDGSWNGERYFSCKDGHALFIVLSKLKPDARFVQQPQGDNRKLSLF